MDGNLEETRDQAGRDFAGQCFVENRLEQPGAPVHHYEFIDTTEGEVEAEWADFYRGQVSGRRQSYG